MSKTSTWSQLNHSIQVNLSDFSFRSALDVNCLDKQVFTQGLWPNFTSSTKQISVNWLQWDLLQSGRKSYKYPSNPIFLYKGDPYAYEVTWIFPKLKKRLQFVISNKTLLLKILLLGRTKLQLWQVSLQI